MQLLRAGDDEFLELVHAALRLRSDIHTITTMPQNVRHIRKGYYGLHSRQSLHVYLTCSLWAKFFTDIDLDDSAEQSKNTQVQNTTFSLVQDLVYNATGGKNCTP